MSEQHRSIAEQAKAAIERGHIRPRSAASVLGEQFVYAVLLFAIFLVLVLGVNLIGFWLRSTGSGVFLGHGLPGISLFFLEFPFAPFALALLAFAVTIFLLKRYDISYKQPFLLISFGFLLGGVLLGAGLAKTGVNEQLAEKVERGELKPLRLVYRKRTQLVHVAKDALIGTVEAVANDAIAVRVHDRLFTVRFTQGMQLRNPNGLVVGARVRVLGTLVSPDTFNATVILVGRPQTFIHIRERKPDLSV